MDRAFFDRPATDVAQALLGVLLCVDGVGGVIVETEAYDRTDPASHSFSGETRRNRSMFGPAAHAYIYRSYGIHWCMNIVCQPGSAVLLRALEPSAGLDTMQARRSTSDLRLLCSGPGRLCQALAITNDLDGAAIDAPPFQLVRATTPGRILAGPRIGITKGVDSEWRFTVAGSRMLSRPR